MAHHMLLRGGSRRQLQLADLFSLHLPNEGPTACRPLIVILDNGNTNQYGRREYIGVMRHRDPLLCTMGQMAFYLFHRWEVGVAGGQEPVPNFWKRQQWYDIHFLKGKDRLEEISYETQLRAVDRIFTAINLSAQKKTRRRGRSRPSWKGWRRARSGGPASGTGTP